MSRAPSSNRSFPTVEDIGKPRSTSVSMLRSSFFAFVLSSVPLLSKMGRPSR